MTTEVRCFFLNTVMKSIFSGEFDMRVKSCAASDGSSHVIQLSDEFGCVLRPKMISRFLKARGADERASVITYAFFHAFKFPDALSVHIKCKVEICRHGCLDHCQLQQPENGDVNADLYQDHVDRKDDHLEDKGVGDLPDVLYDDVGEGAVKMSLNSDNDDRDEMDVTAVPHKVNLFNSKVI